MAVSIIDICNIGLGWVGGNSIMTLDDGTTESDLCKANFETSKNAALEAVDWTFARGRYKLIPSAEVPIGFDFKYVMPLPPDLLVLRWASANGSFVDYPIFEKEGHSLLTNHQEIYIKYTKIVEDTTRFPAKMVHLVATQLAADICVTLTSSTKLEASLRAKFELLTDQTSGVDGLQTLPQKQRATTLKKARFR